MPPRTPPRCCWNCDRISTDTVLMPLESASGSRIALTLCQHCFTSSFAPLLTGRAPSCQGAAARPTVLVVDDDPSIRRLLRLALEGNGFQVDMAANGKEALAKVHDVPPHAIVLDLYMPIMSGPDFLRALRRSSSGQSIPVLAISAYDVHSKATDLEVEAFLAKPLELNALIGTVNGLIARPA